MNLIELSARIQYFLLNQDGLSEDEIVAMQSDSKFELEYVPRINGIASKLKENGQNTEIIDQNRLLLTGGL